MRTAVGEASKVHPRHDPRGCARRPARAGTQSQAVQPLGFQEPQDHAQLALCSRVNASHVHVHEWTSRFRNNQRVCAAQSTQKQALHTTHPSPPPANSLARSQVSPAARGGQAWWWAPTAGPRPSSGRGAGRVHGRRLVRRGLPALHVHGRSRGTCLLGQPCCLLCVSPLSTLPCENAALTCSKKGSFCGQHSAVVAFLNALRQSGAAMRRTSAHALRSCGAANASGRLAPGTSTQQLQSSVQPLTCAATQLWGHTAGARGGAGQQESEPACRRGFAAQTAPQSSVTHRADPFALVADELEAVSARIRAAVVSEVRMPPGSTHTGRGMHGSRHAWVPAPHTCSGLFPRPTRLPLLSLSHAPCSLVQVPTLSTAADYFFRDGAMGKRLRPTVLLLLASALSPTGPPGARLCAVDHSLPRETPTGAHLRTSGASRCPLKTHHL